MFSDPEPIARILGAEVYIYYIAGSSSFLIEFFVLCLPANLYDFLHFFKAYSVICPASDRSGSVHAFCISHYVFSEFPDTC